MYEPGPRYVWNRPEPIGALAFTCGHCGRLVSSSSGLFGGIPGNYRQARVYICPNCTLPNAFTGVAKDNNYSPLEQVPAPSFGEDVSGPPGDVQKVYDEARRSITVNAYSGAVMLCRKLLMHVAVERGAPVGGNFQSYVDYLVNNGYVAPTNKDWVDTIRTIGNEANHELPERTKDDAETLLEFSEMLLKTVYEYPARGKRPTP